MLLVSAQAYHGATCAGSTRATTPTTTCAASTTRCATPFVYLPAARRSPPDGCMSWCPAISAHYVRWCNGLQTAPDGEPLAPQDPGDDVPTANLLHNCVPGAPSLYAAVADRIDQSAFTSVLAGLFRAWPSSCSPPPPPPPSPCCGPRASARCAARARWRCRPSSSPSPRSRCSPPRWGARLPVVGRFADEHPIFRLLEVAINTDMSLVLALVTTVFAVSVAVALWSASSTAARGRRDHRRGGRGGGGDARAAPRHPAGGLRPPRRPLLLLGVRRAADRHRRHAGQRRARVRPAAAVAAHPPRRRSAVERGGVAARRVLRHVRRRRPLVRAAQFFGRANSAAQFGAIRPRNSQHRRTTPRASAGTSRRSIAPRRSAAAAPSPRSAAPPASACGTAAARWCSARF